MGHLSLYPRHLIRWREPRKSDPQMDGGADMKESREGGDRKVFFFPRQETGCNILSASGNHLFFQITLNPGCFEKKSIFCH